MMGHEAFKYSELTSKIIGCAMKVHGTLGNGFQEVIYQKAFELKFIKNNITYNREFDMPIFYEGV